MTAIRAISRVRPASPASEEAEGRIPAPPIPSLEAPWDARLVDARRDTPLLCAWMHQPHVARFWKQAWSRDAWSAELQRQLAGDHMRPCLISLHAEPLAYIEIYRVVRDRLAGHYLHRAHDLGLHVAIGDRARTGCGLGRALLRRFANALLKADPACARIVAEPDRRNVASLRAFAAAGFQRIGPLSLPDKTAMLVAFSRAPEDLP